MTKKLAEYLPEFINELEKQLDQDELRWGDAWKRRPVEGQGTRIEARYNDYFDQHEYAGIPIPWTKIVGEALVGWVRDNHPDDYMT